MKHFDDNTVNVLIDDFSFLQVCFCCFENCLLSSVRISVDFLRDILPAY